MVFAEEDDDARTHHVEGGRRVLDNLLHKGNDVFITENSLFGQGIDGATVCDCGDELGRHYDGWMHGYACSEMGRL